MGVKRGKFMSEEMEEIISRIIEENEQQSFIDGQPVSYEDKVAIDNFKYGYSEGSYGQICENFDVQENNNEPVFGPTD